MDRADPDPTRSKATAQFISPGSHAISGLGIRLISGEWGIIQGIGGRTSTAAFGVVDLRLSRVNRSYRWSARVGFIEGNDVILGHSGFLRHFTASFDGLRRQVNLRPNGTFPEPIAGRAG